VALALRDPVVNLGEIGGLAGVGWGAEATSTEGDRLVGGGVVAANVLLADPTR